MPRFARNKITVENDRPGTAQWRILYSNTALNHEIEGYASHASVNIGETIAFHLSSSVPQGGTRYSAGLKSTGLAFTPMEREDDPSSGRQTYKCHLCAPLADPNVDSIVKCTWPPSFTLAIPLDWTTGVYVAKLSIASGRQSYVLFVVKDDAYPAAFLYPLAVATYQAYNNWGGKLYHRQQYWNQRNSSLLRSSVW